MGGVNCVCAPVPLPHRPGLFARLTVLGTFLRNDSNGEDRLTLGKGVNSSEGKMKMA